MLVGQSGKLGVPRGANAVTAWKPDRSAHPLKRGCQQSDTIKTGQRVTAMKAKRRADDRSRSLRQRDALAMLQSHGALG